MMNGGAVPWYDRQQQVVEMSSAESEYIAMWNGAKETVWLRQLVKIHILVPKMYKATIMVADNQAAITLGNHTSVNRRNKQIDVRIQSTRQLIEDYLLKVEY